MSFILGLDVSTACTGWCILHSDGRLVDLGGIGLSKHSGVYAKSKLVSDVLNALLLKYEISTVYIEENLQSFRRGFSSAQTLSTLARFNGMVSLLCYQVFDREPIHLNVNAARKRLGIKLVRKKQGGKPTKEQVLDWVNDHLDSRGDVYQWPIKLLKGGPRKGTEILDPAAYDMADAYVIALAGVASSSP